MYPDNYQEMDVEEQKGHWSMVLSRGMRWAGEDGYEEISIFDEKLINDLRAFDSNIDALLPEILTGLAVMEMENPKAFMEEVNSRMKTSFEVDKEFLKEHFPNMVENQ